jgi:hypothetical protein
MLKWATKLAVLSMVVSVLASPLLACMVPDRLLTAEERECCKEMADQCGQVQMSASHSCCKETVREIDSYLINSRFVVSHSQALWAPHFTSVDSMLPGHSESTESLLHAHAPPASPPENISVLRI